GREAVSLVCAKAPEARSIATRPRDTIARAATPAPSRVADRAVFPFILHSLLRPETRGRVILEGAIRGIAYNPSGIGATSRSNRHACLIPPRRRNHPRPKRARVCISLYQTSRSVGSPVLFASLDPSRQTGPQTLR